MHSFRAIWRKRPKKSQGTAFKKEGKMERREKWQLWQKWQPAAQATGTSEMENNKKGWLQWNITILIKVYEKV